MVAASLGRRAKGNGEKVPCDSREMDGLRCSQTQSSSHHHAVQGQPLFENVSVKFGDGNRYGLIGANGAAKSTFMKILCGILEPSAGNVALDSGERMAFLRQDQFAYEDVRARRGDDGPRGNVGRHQGKRRDLRQPGRDRGRLHEGRRTRSTILPSTTAIPPRRAPANCCSASASPPSQHNGPMSEGRPGWKLRVLLAQALFANPTSCCSTSRPTTRHQHHPLAGTCSTSATPTMIIISHDRHFLNQVVPTWPTWTTARSRSTRATTDDYMEASTMARERQSSANKGQGQDPGTAGVRAPLLGQQVQGRQATSRLKQIDKIKPEDVKPSSRQYRGSASTTTTRTKLHRQAVEIDNITVRLRSGHATSLHQPFSPIAIEAARRSPSSARTASARPRC